MREGENVETFRASARGNDLNFTDILLKMFYMFFFSKFMHKEPTNTKIMPADFKLISPKKIVYREQQQHGMKGKNRNN